jgi:hypothetical protein
MVTKTLAGICAGAILGSIVEVVCSDKTVDHGIRLPWLGGAAGGTLGGVFGMIVGARALRGAYRDIIVALLIGSVGGLFAGFLAATIWTWATVKAPTFGEQIEAGNRLGGVVIGICAGLLGGAVVGFVRAIMRARKMPDQR